MDQQKQLDKILEAAAARTGNDIGRLLGVKFSLARGPSEVVTGKAGFERLAKKVVCGRMGIAGRVQGQGFLFVGVKDAIRLGGTLIMLPGKELHEVMSREEFSEEIEDSYGEIASIIAESFSKDFEQMHPHSCRFIHKEQELVVPMQVFAGADESMQGKSYFRVSFSMVLEGLKMGDMVMLLPTEALHLLQEDSGGERPVTDAFQKDMPALDPEIPANVPVGQTSMYQASDDLPKNDSLSLPEISHLQRYADKLLTGCCERVAEEVCALLGKNIGILNITNKIIPRDDFFSHEVSGNQALARFEISGDLEETSFLMMNVGSAIRIGGEVNIIPGAELEPMVAAEEFVEDTVDAFSEVINIIAEVYTEVFEDQGSRQVRFAKIDLQLIDPLHVAGPSAGAVPDREYYLSSMAFTMGDGQGVTMHLLLPIELFEVKNRENVDWDRGEADWYGAAVMNEMEEDGPNVLPKAAATTAAGDSSAAGSLDILLIHDEQAETERIRAVLKGLGYSTRNLSFKDNLHRHLSPQLKAIYLVMNDINEQAFGAAIKVSSACSVPLIAAAPGWTRSKVIKAVKYGVCDILLTPASPEDIEKNVTSNLLQFAA